MPVKQIHKFDMRNIKIFIASSSDVSEERNIVGVECGGWGRIIMEIKVENRVEGNKEDAFIK
jgi:hypothetical protein